MGRQKKQQHPLLSEFELEVMNVIWNLRSATVHDVIEKLPRNDYAYTTVSTIMRVLESKDFLLPVKNGKSHIYTPGITRFHYQKRFLEHHLSNLFQNDPASVITQILSWPDLTISELDEIQNLLTEKTQRIQHLPSIDS